MQLRQLRAPPVPAAPVAWRTLYERGRFIQRNLEGLPGLRRICQERGFFLPLGLEAWEEWDAQGALRPIAFGLGRWTTHVVLDPSDADTVVFREEHAFRPWSEYAVEFDRHASTYPLYSPWQLLPLLDVLRGNHAEFPLEVLRDSRRREAYLDGVTESMDAQLTTWRTLDDRWAPALKFLVAIQNRYWPTVSGRVVLPWDAVEVTRYDPMAAEYASFEPLGALDEHGITERDVLGLYKWLIDSGGWIEPGAGLTARRGDGWGRLRQLADRREQRRLPGVPRVALDFYEAAEMLAALWLSLTGTHLPALDVVHSGGTIQPVHDEGRPAGVSGRSREALRLQLIARGLWPGRIHAVVEGNTEVTWVEEILTALFGFLPDDLLITNIHGVGGARRIERLVQTIADYATHSALIVDREGEMARYVQALVDAGLIDPHDVLMFDTSFEEANFSDVELVRVARHLASHPPGDRPAVRLRLTARQLRTEHERQKLKAKGGDLPGLAETLLTLLRTPLHGPVNLKKTELSDGLLSLVLDEVSLEGTARQAAPDRPFVRFVVDRIANPLLNAAWR